MTYPLSLVTKRGSSFWYKSSHVLRGRVSIRDIFVRRSVFFFFFFEGCSEDFLYLFFSILLDTLFLLCDSKPCTHFNIYIYIYQDCYYILSPISSCVVSFLSLCICFLLIVSNLLYFSFTLR